MIKEVNNDRDRNPIANLPPTIAFSGPLAGLNGNQIEIAYGEMTSDVTFCPKMHAIRVKPNSSLR